MSKSAIILSVLLSLMMSFTGPASNALAAPEVVMVATHAQAMNSIVGKMFDKMKAETEALSNGRVQVNVFHAGQLTTSSPQALLGIAGGYIHTTFVQPDGISDASPRLALIPAWPYLYPNPDECYRFWMQSPVAGELLDAIEKESGFRLLGPTWNPDRQIYVTKDIKTFDDLKALKVRVPPNDLFAGMVEMMGMSPSPMGIGDVYSGMQQGIVDGVEGTITDATGYSWVEVTKTVVLTGHSMGPKTWIYKGDWLDSLSQENRDAIVEGTKRASAWFSEQAKKEEAGYLEEFKKRTKVIDSGLTREQLMQKMVPLQKRFPEMLPWVEKIQAFFK